MIVEIVDRASGESKSAALFWIGFACAASITVGPLIVGGLIEGYHYSPRDAGFVAGIETLGIGVGSFLVSSMGARWGRHPTIRYGTCPKGVRIPSIADEVATDRVTVLSRTSGSRK